MPLPTEAEIAAAVARVKRLPPEQLTISVTTTWLDLAKAVGAEFGYALTDDEADALLWEHTGFPGFFDGEPVTACINQLRAHFFSLDDCPGDDDGPTP